LNAIPVLSGAVLGCGIRGIQFEGKKGDITMNKQKSEKFIEVI
jgi:hypothetical protein